MRESRERVPVRARMRLELHGRIVPHIVYARAVDGSAARLRELRHEVWEKLGLAALALALAVASTEVYPALAVPLLLGGLAVGVLATRALWQQSDLLDRLAGDRDAYVIPEVLAYVSREATRERRRSYAASIRSRLGQPETICGPSVIAASKELEALAAELEDAGLALDPACAVACKQLLTELAESALLSPTLPPEEVRSRVRQIRFGFRPDDRLAH